MQLSTDFCIDSASDTSSTAANTVCLLPGKNVTLNCALPDIIIVWSNPDTGKQQPIHSGVCYADLGSDIHLQLDSFVYDLSTSYLCTRASATILNIARELNGLELTCSTIPHSQCLSIFNSTFVISVIGKHLQMSLYL